MQNNTAAHIVPIVLWQCACGGRDLPNRDYLHIMECTGCETLADEIKEALDNLEKELERRYFHLGPN